MTVATIAVPRVNIFIIVIIPTASTGVSVPPNAFMDESAENWTTTMAMFPTIARMRMIMNNIRAQLFRSSKPIPDMKVTIDPVSGIRISVRKLLNINRNISGILP